MTTLIHIIWIPLLGPLLWLAAESFSRSPRTYRSLERGLLLVMAGVILGNVVPANLKSLGPSSLVVTAAVMAAVWMVVEGFDVAARGLREEIAVALTVGGLVIHSIADGAALFSFHSDQMTPLKAAIAADRLAVGYFVWAVLRPVVGPWLSFTILLLLSAASLLGYGLMGIVASVVAEPTTLALVQSALAGLILFLALHHAVKGEAHVRSVAP